MKKVIFGLGILCLFPTLSKAERIGLYFNDAFVEIEEGNVFAEASNLKASLEYLGHELILFNDFQSIATTDVDLLIIPELEKGNLANAMSAIELSAYQSYVSSGGGLIVMGVVASDELQNQNAIDFINKICGTSMKIGSPILNGTCIKNPNILNGEFADCPNSINNNNATVYIESGLPAEANVLYYNEIATDEVAVIQLQEGSGSVMYFGWGWWNAEPVGTQDGGWLDLLKTSIETIACPPPTLEIADSYTFSLELNMSFTLSEDFFGDKFTACTGADISLSKTKFNCDDLGAENIIIVQVTDDIGRVATAEVSIILRDENDVCDLQPLSTFVSGSVKSLKGNPIADVELTLESEYSDFYISNEDGLFSLGLDADSEYSLQLNKISTHAFGVSTNDLRLLTRHVLGLEPFTSPYQYIAGDMNGDKVLDINDITLLQQLILNLEVVQVYPVNWHWVPANYIFSLDQRPLFQDWNQIQASILNVNTPSLDIIGIKIGDVDGSL